jgi:hypothetical protein
MVVTDAPNQQVRVFSTRHVLTASAAASLMLAGTPGLVSSASAGAVAPVSIVAPSSQADRRTVRRRFQSTLRTARIELADATRVAQRVFRAAISVHVGARARVLTRCSTRPARRAAATEFGDAVLPAKIARDEALVRAHEAYVVAVETARVEFLVAAGAQPATVASIRYEHAVHVATATYRREVQRARRSMKAEAREARLALKSVADAATDDVRRSSAQRAFQNANTDSRDVFRVRVSTARTAFTTHISLAKTSLKASMSMALA